MVNKMTCITLSLVVMAALLATQTVDAQLAGLGGLIPNLPLLGGLVPNLPVLGGGGVEIPTVPIPSLPQNCDPTKLVSCVTSFLSLKVLPISQACCSSVSSQLSCFCQFNSGLQQLLSTTAGQLLTVCGVSLPACT